MKDKSECYGRYIQFSQNIIKEGCFKISEDGTKKLFGYGRNFIPATKQVQVGEFKDDRQHGYSKVYIKSGKIDKQGNWNQGKVDKADKKDADGNWIDHSWKD